MRTVLCENCRRYAGVLQSGIEGCDAYPAGIPAAILTAAADHRLPYAGDRGLRYDPIHDLDLDPPDADPVVSDGEPMP